MIEPKYRHSLPQLAGKDLLTDGGLETCLIFHEGLELPLFAAFTMLDDQEGKAAIDRYMRRFCELAVRDKKGFVLDTPTWRASKKWADEIGYSQDELEVIHKQAIVYLSDLREEYESGNSQFVINGAIGPQDDGYNPEAFLSVEEAYDYHRQQVSWFATYGTDMISAVTMTYVEEALGITKAAKEAGVPVVISFTVETDGRLPSGQPLSEAIEQVDRETDNGPAYYMINCAHPDHFSDILEGGSRWCSRIMGLRANASRMSHEELDNSEVLDDGNPEELGMQYQALRKVLPNLAVVGGCCGTDHRHIDAISLACG